MTPDPIPLILDTDIGTDVDDAVALAYLLRQPRCELLGITTVTGEPDRRAMLADAQCRAAGRTDIPVHAGAATPLIVPQAQTTAAEAEVLPRWPHRERFAPNTAVDFLRQTVRARPGEITLLAIGPLTNVALLFAVDPEIPSLLHRFVMMGGVYGAKKGSGYFSRPAGAVTAAGGQKSSLTPFSSREWNTRGDPHATAIVFAAAARGHTTYGLDVTARCRLPVEDCRQRFRGGQLDLVAEMAEVWFRERDAIIFHDPLAAACIFEPDLCRYDTGRAEIELHDPDRFGTIAFQPDRRGPHRVAVDADVERLFAHYFAVARP